MPARSISLTPVPVLLVLPLVAACTDSNRSARVRDPEPVICAPVPADLISSTPETAPYYITLGHAELESTAPRDDQGRSDDIYAIMHRRDTVVESRIADAVGQRKHAVSRLTQLRDEREALGGADNDTAAIDERIREAEAARERIDADLAELRQLVSGRTPTRSRQANDILFNDWPMPFRVYAGDTIEVRIAERDPFQDDLLGHTEFVVDAITLQAGRLVLRTGWVQSLPLGFAPCD